MGDIEVGTCDVCSKEQVPVSRTYYEYDAKCECCNDAMSNHFEIVWTCKDCEPKAPESIKLMMKPNKVR